LRVGGVSAGEGDLERVGYPWNEVWREWIIIGRQYQVFAAVLPSFRVFFDATLVSLNECLPTFGSNLVLSSSEPNSLVP
jgi:hypothetical protein